MGEYGTVYVTYHLTYATRTSGFVSGNGRGAIDANNVAAGAFRGVWTREMVQCYKLGKLFRLVMEPRILML